MKESVVIARCVSCGAKREIKAREIPKGETPICSECGMPMIAEKALAES